MKRIVLIVLCLLMLTSCSKGTEEVKTDSGIVINKPAKEIQDTAAEKGETIATMTIKDYGDIKIKFFADSAPKAVENFLALASDGYYDGVTFHRVIADFMIQGGDPTASGSGGESYWGEDFEDEFTDLVPIYGSLCMANAGPNTNSSQFFIVQSKDSYEEYLPMLNLSDAQQNLFKKYGGTPWLYEAHTVFGQVYEGMDVIDKIANTATDGSDRPIEDVVIESIMISTAE